MGKDYADLTGMTHQNGNTSPDGHLFSPASIDGSEHGENDKRQAIGRVASPMRSESTSVRCYFWVPRGTLVEKTQLVRTESKVAGGEPISFFGVVEEVYRRSRRRSFDEEFDNFDGEIDYEPPFKAEGVTYAEVSILRSEPPILTPPLEESLVFLSTEADAGATYGYDTMIEHAEDGSEVANWGLPVGLLRNGGTATVGVARIDLRDLVGDRAGHLNVTGQAGRGTKSSFLLVVVRALINFARQWDDGTPGRQPFSVRPIVFNVKGNDLMYIDAPNRHLTGQQRQTWAEMGIEPEPFQRAEFYAPCRPTHGAINRAEPRMLRPRDFESQTKPYYWTLTDVIRFGLWTYLYSEDARNSDTLMAMVDHVLDVLAEDCPPDREHPAGLQLRAPSPDSSGIPQSFQALRIWLRDALANQHHPARDHGIHAHGTCRALLSRLGLVLDQDGRAIFDDGVGTGRPLLVTDGNRSTAPAVARNSSAPREIEPNRGDPLVVDIATLPPDLRRFVVAAVLDQVKANQMGP
ncbi:MAG: hypothetical protein ACR2PL_01400 [Dehalococcoidia bacterium]